MAAPVIFCAFQFHQRATFLRMRARREIVVTNAAEAGDRSGNTS